MSSPCNNLNVVPIKVSQLVRYRNIDVTDYLLTVESGSAVFSRKSTFGDLIRAFGTVTGSYTGSFSGSFRGKVTGSFKGWIRSDTNNSRPSVISGSTSGSFYGKAIGKHAQLSGSFSGSMSGSLKSKNANLTGSISGSLYGKLVTKNAIASGSFSGSYFGKLVSKNAKITGSLSGSVRGAGAKISGSFSGSHFGKFIGKNAQLTGSFKGFYSGSINATGSLYGKNNITNFKGTGKAVSFNGTSSYAVSSSYADSLPIPVFARYVGVDASTTTLSLSLPTGKTVWKEFSVDCYMMVKNLGAGTVTNILSYGTGAPFISSSVAGCGNSGVTYTVESSDDNLVAVWSHFGVVSSSFRNSNPLTIKYVRTFGGTSPQINNISFLVKAYCQ